MKKYFFNILTSIFLIHTFHISYASNSEELYKEYAKNTYIAGLLDNNDGVKKLNKEVFMSFTDLIGSKLETLTYIMEDNKFEQYHFDQFGKLINILTNKPIITSETTLESFKENKNFHREFSAAIKIWRTSIEIDFLFLNDSFEENYTFNFNDKLELVVGKKKEDNLTGLHTTVMYNKDSDINSRIVKELSLLPDKDSKCYSEKVIDLFNDSKKSNLKGLELFGNHIVSPVEQTSNLFGNLHISWGQIDHSIKPLLALEKEVGQEIRELYQLEVDRKELKAKLDKDKVESKQSKKDKADLRNFGTKIDSKTKEIKEKYELVIKDNLKSLSEKSLESKTDISFPEADTFLIKTKGKYENNDTDIAFKLSKNNKFEYIYTPKMKEIFPLREDYEKALEKEKGKVLENNITKVVERLFPIEDKRQLTLTDTQLWLHHHDNLYESEIKPDSLLEPNNHSHIINLLEKDFFHLYHDKFK